MSTFKEQIAPLGKFAIFALKEQIDQLRNALQKNEIILAVAEHQPRPTTILAYTNLRLIAATSSGYVEFDTSKITCVEGKRKTFSFHFSFIYEGKNNLYKIPKDQHGEHLTNSLLTERHNFYNGAKTVPLVILSGNEQLGLGAFLNLNQLTPGTAFFSEWSNPDSKTFQFLGYEANNNIKKSKLDTLAGAALGGVLFGTAGSVAGASAMSQGEDLSTATLHLRDCETGIHFQMVVNCSPEINYALSVFSTNTMPISQPTNQNINTETEQLIKYKDYLDQGLITQDDYDAKKKQILGL